MTKPCLDSLCSFLRTDHSGLYQYQLSCGNTADNDKFFAMPLTPWKSLHQTGETTTALNEKREVGAHTSFASTTPTTH